VTLRYLLALVQKKIFVSKTLYLFFDVIARPCIYSLMRFANDTIMIVKNHEIVNLWHVPHENIDGELF